jgi:hypothetical protein
MSGGPTKCSLDLIEFNPNKLDGIWGVHDGAKWRLFPTLRGALASRGFHPHYYNVRLFELVGGVWVQRVRRIESEMPDTCDLCRGSTSETDARGFERNMGLYCLMRKSGKIVHPLTDVFVCRACERHVR